MATILVAALLAAPPAFAQSAWRVPDDHRTLQAAVDAAAAGDSITVAPGKYAGAIVGQRLDIVGSGPDTILIGGEADHVLLLLGAAHGATISNLTIENAPQGVVGLSVHEVTIRDLAAARLVVGVLNVGGNGWTIANNVLE